MNKTTKKIMALILSLVMLFGYIPCNIANASGETKTLGELLATISFPTTEGTGWISERGNIAHIDSENGELKLIP
ncbi:MAG: hypothetical protein MJ246_08685 [Clostridia bacterium]|nr:hypothetical protein [Clostridia bacterium]